MHVLPDRSIASIRQRVSPDAVGERDETGKFSASKKKKTLPRATYRFFIVHEIVFFCDTCGRVEKYRFVGAWVCASRLE